MRVTIVKTFMASIILASGWCVSPVHAELSPNQVMIVANANSRDSLVVGQHYATRRGIPVQHIVKLDLPLEDTLSWEDYEQRVVLPLRQWSQSKGIHREIRVVVTVYGVPLRVASPVLTTDERRWRHDAENRLAAARSRLLGVERKAREIPGSSTLEVPPVKSGQAVLEVERNIAFLERIDRVAQEVVKRGKVLDPSTRAEWYERIESLIRQYQGIAGVAQLNQDLSKNGETSESAESKRLRVQQGEGLQLLLGSVELPVRRDRDRLYRMAEQVYGAYGVFGLATLELSRLSTEQADASLDSELSLLWWDRDQYGAGWRQSNVFYHGFKKLQRGKRKDIPVLMVSRLDAPTAELAIGLVDRALEAELRGLTGTVYLDARGLPVKDTTDTYGRYDQSLRNLNVFVTQHTSYRSTLENTEARFHRPGEAPDVALYVGWYRLRQYEDAFTFRPGAIGYHMASAEAVSIHATTETGWCKNALDHRITATLGSVGEPYLDAFPEPLEFAALLMTGQYSLVEAYYLTSRWVSWRMVLFGDPLYNPWKKSPAAQRSTLTMFTLAPVAPSDRAFDDPLQARDELRRARDQSRARLDEILQNQSMASKQPGQ